MKEEHVTTMLKTGHFLLLQQILHNEHLRYKPRPRRPSGISLLSCEIVGFWAGRNIKLYAAKSPGPFHSTTLPSPNPSPLICHSSQILHHRVQYGDRSFRIWRFYRDISRDILTDLQQTSTRRKN